MTSAPSSTEAKKPFSGKKNSSPRLSRPAKQLTARRKVSRSNLGRLAHYLCCTDRRGGHAAGWRSHRDLSGHETYLRTVREVHERCSGVDGSPKVHLRQYEDRF